MCSQKGMCTYKPRIINHLFHYSIGLHNVFVEIISINKKKESGNILNPITRLSLIRLP